MSHKEGYFTFNLSGSGFTINATLKHIIIREACFQSSDDQQGNVGNSVEQ